MSDQHDGVLSEAKLLELLSETDPTTRTLVLHVLAKVRATDEHVGALEEIVFVIKKSYRLVKWCFPFALPVGGFILARLVS